MIDLRISGAYQPNGGNTYNGLLRSGIIADSGGGYRPPMYARQTWYKCPFCGHRQNIDNDGGECKKCNGDLMHEGVK